MLAAAAVSAGCSALPGAGARLEVGLADGELVIPADASPTRHATLGGGLLCTTGEPVTIRSITYDTPVSPVSIESFVRSVDEPPSARVDTVAGLPGTPQEFMDEPNPGALRDAEGFEVTTSCSEGSSTHRYDELLIGATASQDGAVIDGMVVEYESGGRSRSVEVVWTYTFCGDRIESDDCLGDV